MEFTEGSKAFGFVVTEASDLPEIDGRAFVLRHEASGARLLYLANDDNNKAFSIAFKTPPKDNTGVFHILEHSVLCGSKNYQLKEPFVNLLKNSMQTFLNAMTGPDFTVYPVASINEQDLLNLAHVYMDAVVYPNIYTKPETFLQEGWHLEVQEGEEENDCKPSLAFNGVVLNEMKGALSDPLSVLINVLNEGMYPDTAYGFESGGDPDVITTLKYEDFLNTHSRHYRLDNSYLLLYGNLNAERFLEFLDSEYLSPAASLYKDAGEPNPLVPQAPVKNLGMQRELVTAPTNACAGVAFAAGMSGRDQVRLLGSEVLLDALTDTNDSPLTRAILDAGLADDVMSFQGGGQMQPYEAILLRGTHVEDASERVVHVVQECIKKLLSEGLDHQLIEAVLSRLEFQTRECDFGYPDGILYAMGCLQTWFFDEEAATTNLRYEQVFAELRKGLQSDYFERLARSLFLENEHMASAQIIPIEANDTQVETQCLSELAAEMNEDDFDAVRAQTARLREVQERPDDPAEVAKLPHLGVQDIENAPDLGQCKLDESGDVPLLSNNVNSKGINYINRYYSLEGLEFDELPLATVLGSLLGKLDTKKHTTTQINILNKLQLGTINFAPCVFVEHESARSYPKFIVRASALDCNVAAAAELPAELMFETKFLDSEGKTDENTKAKVKEILTQIKVGMQQNFANRGNLLAINQAAACYSQSALISSQLTGIDYYRFLKDLLEHYDERACDLLVKLDGLCTRIFRESTCIIGFTGTEESRKAYLAAGKERLNFAADNCESKLVVPEPTACAKAYVVPGQGSYSALAFNRRKLNSEHSGAWIVASRTLSYDFLWNEVRMKGGAYGCGFITKNGGGAHFYTYRDPNLDASFERFAASAQWLSEFDPNRKELEGYIVSIVANMDEPLKPSRKAGRLESWYISKFNPEIIENLRQEVIEVSAEQVRACAKVIERIIERDCRCVVGSREIIEASKMTWDLDEVLMS